ncbi:MAG: TetR/AcrR family transcriptional regulator [Actinomycetota bacterium]
MNEAAENETRHRSRRAAPSERRTRALDAFIDLVLEHGTHPRPEEVAERADVSIASLYRYFTDLDELRNDAVARLAERYPDLFVIADIGTGPRDERIASFARARLALHETLYPLELLGRATGLHDDCAQRHVESARAAMANQINRHFDVELQTLSTARRDDTVATIAALTSVETWQQFRHSYGRTATQTRRAWSTAIAALLPTVDQSTSTARQRRRRR